ncbi:MAG TPA: hypothetical protein VM621_06270 [Luteibacter sp.]|uniref:hypothetical protein n=1 Tax=Luteibacter sp. TaxID=1886636 RepID=UPI002C84184A|nr:hypothetical protein [Luteibacter sp.]HVI54639.1 hypothetical protein [Luteibacter sp.]
MRAAMLTIVVLLLPVEAWAGGPPDVAAAVASVHAGVPASLTLNLPAPTPAARPIADELIPPVPYTAQTVAFVKTFVVTATYAGRPYRVEVVVVDSQGLVYSTSQQGGSHGRDDESDDRLDVTVTGLAPVVFDLSVRKADANAAATRDRVAVGDLEQGHSAFALRDHKLAVVVERLDDEVDLR